MALLPFERAMHVHVSWSFLNAFLAAFKQHQFDFLACFLDIVN